MSLSEKVYNLLKKVPKGKVTTYKEIAHALGTKAYRAVGQALKRNPDSPRIPCHRVVFASGKIGGFMGKKNGKAIKKKITLLEKEGIKVIKGKIKEFEDNLFKF